MKHMDKANLKFKVETRVAENRKTTSEAHTTVLGNKKPVPEVVARYPEVDVSAPEVGGSSQDDVPTSGVDKPAHGAVQPPSAVSDTVPDMENYWNFNIRHRRPGFTS